MEFNLLEFLAKVAVFFPPFLFALCFHELAHGWTAKKFGDPTAEHMGRLTMNPMAHIDVIGTVVLPIMGVFTGFIFGWAKPVPVNPRNLPKPKEQMFWVAFAGPLSNIILGFVGGILFVLVSDILPDLGFQKAISSMLYYFLIINAMLAVFNMIPLHPLDGGKILARFLPEEWNQKLEEMAPYSTYILLGFILLGGFQILMIPMDALTKLFLLTGQILLSPFS